jgi:hypothetical protein
MRSLQMKFIDEQMSSGLELLFDSFVLHEIHAIHRNISSQHKSDRSQEDNDVLAASKVLIKYYMPSEEFLEWLKGEEQE